ncbi:MAG: DUF2934 domain-containing protein [Nitrospirota bacterium]|nr:DUF2934 domain-containing protein [Nitrospirota bacterium]
MVVTFQGEFRNRICSFLEGKGYKVCVPPHRQDMLPLVKEKNPLVILLDMYVSEPNGLKVLKELRAQNYRGKVVLLAGRSVSSLISETWHFGVDQVIGGFQGDGESHNLDQVESAIKMAIHSDIAKRAFELYEARGRTQGTHLEDWYEAERQILNLKLPLPSSGQTKTQAESKRISKKKEGVDRKQDV